MNRLFMRRTHAVRKVLISFSDKSKSWLVLRGEAFNRGISEQELIRAVIIPEWLKSHPEERIE